MPLVPDFPGDLVDASIASPAVGMLSKTLWKDTCYFVNYLKCNHNQKDFLDGWVYGYLEEFNSCGWGTAVPSEKLPPRVTWVICGSAWSLGVLGLGYFIGVYKKSKSKISVINVKGL
ncbi:MAG: hypothetical protein LBJ77_03300 [Holosporales bacterium]|nr:hypothetical protein [Holosporales bacterium]